MDVREPKASADQATVAERCADFLRAGVSDDIEVLGLPPEQQIPDAAADQIRLVPLLFQAIENLERGITDQGP